MRKVIATAASLFFAGALVFFAMTMGRPLGGPLPGHNVDLPNGELLFWAGACASCHTGVDEADADSAILSGGKEFSTPFGVFRTPNISSDPEYGIGGWSSLDFVNAMLKGLSPDNQHYYPIFPYPHYQNMKIGDLLDLKAYLDTLPSSSNRVAGHSLRFPYSIRRGVGLWKWRYLSRTMSSADEEATSQVERGRYLVHGAGHCGACHTDRDGNGAEIPARMMAGGESFEIDEGEGGSTSGRIPNITPHADGIGAWSESDIAYALETGFDPDFDSFGGSMVAVQENMARLPARDREAIAAYLKSIAPLPDNTP